MSWLLFYVFFFFNDTATTEIYTLSLHDALPISLGLGRQRGPDRDPPPADPEGERAQRNRAVHHVHAEREVVERHGPALDRKSTRLNSSHANISYAVFCLKKKKNPLTHKSLHDTT